MNRIVIVALSLMLAACGGDGGAGSGAIGSGGGPVGPNNPQGCLLSSDWSVTYAASGGVTITVALHSAGQTTTFDRQGGSVPTAHIDGVYTYDNAAGQIAFTNKSVQTTDPNFEPCIGVVGTYKLTFNDCTHFGLQVVSDNCSVRVQSLGRGSTVLTKQ